MMSTHLYVSVFTGTCQQPRRRRAARLGARRANSEAVCLTLIDRDRRGVSGAPGRVAVYYGNRDREFVFFGLCIILDDVVGTKIWDTGHVNVVA